MGGLLAGNALLALASAVLWGVGDFSGGMGVRTTGDTAGGALRVVLLSHAASLAVLAALAFYWGEPFPQGAPLVWGLVAGFTGGLALVAFYVALARGAMGGSAAISGLLAAAIPSAVSMVVDGVPGWRRGVGLLVAGGAIWLIGAGKEPAEASRSTFWLAIGAGAGFGLYFVALKYAAPGGVVWPMATARIGSLSTCGSILLLLSDRVGPAKLSPRVLAWALAAALFDTTGNLMFLAATRAGRLDVAAVLASLYPASTILLAAAVLREWPSRRQELGMAVALVAVVLVAL